MNYIDKIIGAPIFKQDNINFTVEFIRQNIKSMTVTELYNAFSNSRLNNYSVCCKYLTAILMTCGTNPLSYMEYVPSFYGEEIIDGTFIVPDNIKTVDDNGFALCRNVKSIVLPEGLIAIGDNAFEDCISLESLYLPSTLREVGAYAFWNCPRLTIHYNGSTTKCFNDIEFDDRGTMENDAPPIIVKCTDGELKLFK